MTYTSENGSNCSPADTQPGVNAEPDHVLNVVVITTRAVDPGDGNALEAANPEQRHPARRVVVKQLEHVHTSLKHIKTPQNEKEQPEKEGACCPGWNR